VFDDRYGHPAAFRLERCKACGHVMTAPRLAEADLGELYGTYYPRKALSVEGVARQSAGVAGWRARWGRWWLGTDNQGQYQARPGDRMLDVGCGAGASLLEAQALGAQAWGVEADPNVQRIAQALGLRIHAGNLHDQPFADEAFDLIVLNQVIEHIPEPDETLRLLRSRLAPGGRMVLVFPNTRSLWCCLSGARWINWHVPYHLHHFNLATFRQMAQRCGYRVTRRRTITPNLWLVLQFRASRQVPVRGVPSSMWAVAPAANDGRGGRPARSSLRSVVVSTALGLLGIPARLVDALGWGDSLWVELSPESST
jgi:SAM-dependent methyltransferase